MIKDLSKIEPEITDYLTNLVKNTDGKMEGLDFRIKSFDSLKRKLLKYGVKNEMNDILRYTIIFDKVSRNINQIIHSLNIKVYKTIKLRNTFKEG